MEILLSYISKTIKILSLLLLGPREAALYAGEIHGRPDLGVELAEICMRESRCQSIAIHKNDTPHAASMYRKAVAREWLTPSTCPAHNAHGEKDTRRFGVRGAYGTSAAYTLHHLGGCHPPEVLDIPVVAAIAAIKRMQYQCGKHGACTKQARRRMWAGAARYDKRLKIPGC